MASVVSLFILPFVFGIQPWNVNEHHNTAVRYGDMLLTPSQLQRYSSSLVPSPLPPVRGGAVVVENSYNRWPLNTIPFEISTQYSKANAAFIKTSLAALQASTCFKFIERTTQKDFIAIAPMDGCYSFVGRMGGRQLMSLSLDCLADYIIWHEILHVLGFEHEHQRPDRDNFIKVEYKNVQAGQMVNFEKLKVNSVDISDPYDYKSIMHYDGQAFGRFDSKTGRRLSTMLPVKKGIILVDNVVFSDTDLKKLRVLGKWSKTEQKDERVCADFADICEKVATRGFCGKKEYYDLLRNDCRKSCGWCEPSYSHEKEVTQVTEATKECIDQHPNCHNIVKNGFCEAKFYKDHYALCAKSCKLC